MGSPTDSIQRVAYDVERLCRNMGIAIQGKPEVIRNAVICLLSQGHLLLEDVPGTGKTSLARALASSISLSWHRIQFTPDLLPSDVTGVSIYNQADPASSNSRRARSSRTSCWPTRSTAPRRRRSPRCSR